MKSINSLWNRKAYLKNSWVNSYLKQDSILSILPFGKKEVETFVKNKDQDLKQENKRLKNEVKRLKKEAERNKAAMAEALALLTLKKSG